MVVGGHAAELLVVDQFGQRRLLAADGAVGVLAQPHLVEGHRGRVVEQQAADERLAHAQDELDGLGGLDGPDRARQHTQHAALGATGHQARRRRLREETAVARALFGIEHRRLPLETEDAAVDVGLAQQHAGVISQITRREVVGAVDDDVVGREQFQCVSRGQRHFVRVHLHVGVDVENALLGAFQLQPANVLRAVDDLPLQVGVVDGVVVDQADAADAGRGQVHGQR